MNRPFASRTPRVMSCLGRHRILWLLARYGGTSDSRWLYSRGSHTKCFPQPCALLRSEWRGTRRLSSYCNRLGMQKQQTNASNGSGQNTSPNGSKRNASPNNSKWNASPDGSNEMLLLTEYSASKFSANIKASSVGWLTVEQISSTIIGAGLYCTDYICLPC